MKKILNTLFILAINTVLLIAQTPITSGMVGSAFRNNINNNFSTIYERVDTLQNTVDSLEVSSANYISLLNFGAVGDNNTDNTTSFTNAVNYCLTNDKTLYIPAGEFYIASNIIFDVTEKNIKIVSDAKSVLRLNDKYLSFIAAANAGYTLEDDISAGDSYITTTNLHLVVEAGDLLQIRSTDEYANAGISNHKKGEIVKVKSVDVDKIYTTKSLYDSYSSSTTTVSKLNSGSVSIYGVEFINTNIKFDFVSYSTIDDVIITNGAELPGIQLYNCFDVVISNSTILRLASSFIGSLYGIGVAGSQDVTIINNNVSSWPQGIAAGGEYPVRNYNVLNNTITGAGAQLDTHTNIQYSLIQGNLLFDGAGIYSKGEFVDIINNTLANGCITRLREDLGTEINPGLHKTQYENIINNKLLGGIGIWVGFDTQGDTVDYINISGNYVKSTTQGILLFAEGPHPTTHIRHFNIVNNYIESLGTNNSYCLYFNAEMSIKTITFDNNIIKQAGPYGVYASNGTTIEELKFNNNYIQSTSTSDHAIIISGVTNTKMSNNTFDNVKIVVNTTNLHLEKNVFKNIKVTGNYTITQGLTTDEGNSIRSYNNQFNLKTRRFYINHPVSAEIGEVEYYTGALTDDAPTAAEINGIVEGTALQMSRGYKAIIKDNTGTGLVYECVSNGTSWTYVKRVNAL